MSVANNSFPQFQAKKNNYFFHFSGYNYKELTNEALSKLVT